MTATGCKMLLKDVQHVPEVRLNLILAGRLDDEGYTVSRYYARAWRRAGPRGSWTKEKGRRNRASEWSLAQEEKE